MRIDRAAGNRCLFCGRAIGKRDITVRIDRAAGNHCGLAKRDIIRICPNVGVIRLDSRIFTDFDLARRIDRASGNHLRGIAERDTTIRIPGLDVAVYSRGLDARLVTDFDHSGRIDRAAGNLCLACGRTIGKRDITGRIDRAAGNHCGLAERDVSISTFGKNIGRRTDCC